MPRRAAPPKPRDRLPTDARRKQILDAAIATFAVTPYEAVNMDEFAAALGISKGLVFHYFPTKRALYVAGLVRETQALLDATKPRGVGLTHVRANLEAYLSYVETRREAFLYLMRGAAAADEEVAAIMDDMRARYVERATEHMRAMGMAIDPGDPMVRLAMRGWVGLVETASTDWLAHRSPDKPRLLDYLVRMLTAAVETIASARLA